MNTDVLWFSGGAGASALGLGMEVVEDGLVGVRGRNGVVDVDRENGVPLTKTTGNAAPDRFTSKVVWCRGSAADESVKKTVLEAGKERRRQAAAREEGVGVCFSYCLRQNVSQGNFSNSSRYSLTRTIDQDLGIISIRSHQYRLVIDLFVGVTGDFANDLEQLSTHANISMNPSATPGDIYEVQLTVFVMPSVNLMNSISPSPCSHCGLTDKTNRSAEACESALL